MPTPAGLGARGVVAGRVLLDVHLASLRAARIAYEDEANRLEVARELADARMEAAVIAVSGHLVFSHGKSPPYSDLPPGGRMVEIGSDGWPSTRS